MPRRKQGRPAANPGRIEDRIDASEINAALQANPSNAGRADEKLEQWEEEHALLARPRKRPRQTSHQAQLVDIVSFDTLEYPFTHLQLRCTEAPMQNHASSISDAVEVSAAKGTITFTSLHGASLWLQAVSEEAAESFVSLLHSRHLRLGRHQTAASPANSGCLEEAAGTHEVTVLCGLGRKALQECTHIADDERQRVSGTRMLHVLRWLCPHAGLNPDVHMPANCREDVLGSPLCSPKSRTEATSAVANSASVKQALATSNTAIGDFDASELYAAVKPSGSEPELAHKLPQLRPTLRRYQLRAAQWMLQRETQPEDPSSLDAGPSEPSLHPLWRKVECVSVATDQQEQDQQQRPPPAAAAAFDVNPWTGMLSLERFVAPEPVRGGIACDEMGLGKTVEVLALLVANPYTGPAPTFSAAGEASSRAAIERIDCVCGVRGDVFDDRSFDGLWLQCETCLAWHHGQCVGHPRRPPNGDYICGTCLRARAATAVTQPCGTTLIVCPASILWQWHQEIHRHIVPGAFQVLVYEGQPQPMRGGQKRRVVTAAELAAADIVLTTYDVLRKDLYHCPDADAEDAHHGLRKQKRYQVIPTPLTRLKFWRVAIDEAQMVESSTAKAAAMALRLKTVHRWCITGTPLSRGLEDLQGLMAFLRMYPYGNRTWWRRCIQTPYEAGSLAARARLLSLLKPSAGGLMWRSAKADVKDELNLPPQHHHLTVLDLSAIERHFYDRQHRDCVGKAQSAIPAASLAAARAARMCGHAGTVDGRTGSSGTDRDVALHFVDGPTTREPAPATTGTASSHDDVEIIVDDAGREFRDRPLTRREEHKLLHPLLRLRQACVHPQIGSSGLRSLAPSQAPMTMGEVLEVLLSKTRGEAEEAQRQLVASLNGLAGLLLLQGLHADAVNAYREALRCIKDNARKGVKADKLQQIHALHNLAELLEGPAGSLSTVSRTLEDSDLRRHAAALRDEYLAEGVSRLADAESRLKEAREETAKAAEIPRQHAATRSNVDELLFTWYIDAIHLLTHHAPEGGLGVASHICDQLGASDIYRFASAQNAVSMARRFRDLTGLMRVLQQELQGLQRARKAAFDDLDALSVAVVAETPSSELVEQAGACTRCRNELSLVQRVCRHCKLDEKFVGLEVRLFSLIAAKGSGAQMTADEAARKMLNQTFQRRIGRGGLGEKDGLIGPSSSGATFLHGRKSCSLGHDDEEDGAARMETSLAPSQTETALRLVHQHLRALKVPAGALTARKELLLDAAKACLKTMEKWREEFLQARAAALEQRQKLYLLDELSMCVARLQLRAPGEYVEPTAELFKVFEAEIPVKSAELSGDKAIARDVLLRKLGTLRYLEGLAAGQDRRSHPKGSLGGSSGGDGQARDGGHAMQSQRQQPSVDLLGDAADDACPVCMMPLHSFSEVCMLPCGHRVCWSDHMRLIERASALMRGPQKHVNCPTCRMRTLVSDISVVKNDSYRGAATDAQNQNPQRRNDACASTPWCKMESTIRVSGSYGTKIEAVVRRLTAVTQADPEAKVLVFSCWKEVLELISHALNVNRLPHLYPRTGKHFEAALVQFRRSNEEQQPESPAKGQGGPNGGAIKGKGAAKRKPSPQAGASKEGVQPRILLLLLKQGGNGLNLQQAQHVVMVEPQLDPAEEAQAVGRVDRIGQTHETHVHRFVVQHSIEENVHQLSQHRAAAMDLAAAAVRRGKGGADRGGLTIADVAVLLRDRSADDC